MTTAADIRFGRRGGRWADPDAGRHRHAITTALPQAHADPGKGKDRTTCAVCGRWFTYRTGRKAASTPPAICGHIHCRARHTWGPEDWAGRARMAAARIAAGRPLDDLDHEALQRVHPTVSTRRTGA
jgi:hypothetical protein